MASTDNATLFLDRELRILRFTPTLGERLDLRMADLGSPLTELVERLGGDELRRDAEQVLRERIAIERMVQLEGRWYRACTRPSRGTAEQLERVVVTLLATEGDRHSIEQEAATTDAFDEADESLASELPTTEQLHELGSRLLAARDLPAALDEVLAASIEIGAAKMGNVRLFDPATGKLEIVAQRGLDPKLLERIRVVGAGSGTASSLAMQNRQRVIVEDVQREREFEPLKEMAAKAGFRAVQAMPLIRDDGALLGVLSIHYAEPHRPSARELRALDLYARQAADLIERVRNETALCESEERYRILVESAREYAILMLDLDGRISSWSTGAKRIFGYTEAEALGRPGTIIFTPEDRAHGVPEAEMQIAARDGHASDDRWQLRKDGSRFWASGAMEALAWPDGSIRGFAKVLRDNTERKEAEEALQRLNETLEERVEERTREVRQHEERFRKLIEASALTVWSTNAEGQVVDDSPTWQAFTGQTLEDRQAEGWANAVHPDERALACKSWFQSLATVTPLNTEYRIYHAPTGKYRWTAARAVPLRNEAGAIRGWIGMNIDIEELKQAEARVRDLATRLTAAEREERGRIAQILHDDLQQVLSGIQMKLSMIHSEVQQMDRPQLQEDVNDVRIWTRQALATTRQLTVDLSPPVLQKEGLTDALSWLRTQMKELHGLEVTVEAEHGWYVRNADLRVLLFQIVQELLFNVKKHAGVDRATVRLDQQEGHLVIHVIDAGKGFDTDKLAGIEDYAGGFGLISVRERLNLLGGRLRVQSQPGKGTHIEVYPPVQLEVPQ